MISYPEPNPPYQPNASNLRSKRSMRSFHDSVCLSRSRRPCKDQIHECRSELLAAVAGRGFRDCKSTLGLFRSRKQMTCQAK